MTFRMKLRMTFKTWDFRGAFKDDFEGDLEGDLVFDLEGDSKGDFKQDMEGDLLSSSGQVWISLQHKLILLSLTLK